MTAMASGKLALVAGEGLLPVEILKGLIEKGEPPLVYALRQDPSELEMPGISVIHIKELNLVKIFASLTFRRVKRLLLAGYVPKKTIYSDSMDEETSGIVGGLRDRDDHALLGAVIDRVEKLGISVARYDSVVPEMISKMGHIAGPPPMESDLDDVEYGRSILGKLLPLSFGQSLVVSKRAVVAVEAMEGTDQAVMRAGAISRSGIVVKGMRPDQDRRYDIPVVGLDTLRSMSKAGLSCLALEAGNCLILGGSSFSQLSCDLGISVIGVGPCPSS